MKYDVFISYSSHDQKVVEGLCGHLESRGIRCFVAYRDIPRGVVWADAIVEALDESRMMVVVFSENFNNSAQVNREIELASEDGKHILTYRLTDIAFRGAKKYYLKNLNWIDAFPNPEQTFGSVAEGVAKLLGLKLKKVVEAEEEMPVVTTPNPTPAPKPNPTPTPAPKPTPTPTPTPKKPYPNYLWALALIPLVLIGLWLGIDSYQEKQAVLREQQAQELAEAKAEQERIAQEKAEQERQAQEEAAKKAEQERQAKLEQERIAQAKAEQERQAQEKAAKKAEQERLAKMVAEGKGRDGVYQVGDYYNRNGKQGVVFAVSDGGRHGKIVSLTQSSDELQWCSDEEFERKIETGASDERNGMNNQRKIQQISGWREKYPAFAYCADQGEGWYLPAIEELKIFSLNDAVHDAVNRTLQAKGGTKLFDKGDSGKWYWSSTERDYKGDRGWKFCAWGVDVSSGSTDDLDKLVDLYVRAVSAF